MKKITLISLLLFSALGAYSQHHLHVKSGKTFSTFLFRNSENTKDETLNHIANNFIGMSYDMNLGKLHVFRPEVAYREAGARSALNNQKLSWNLNYIDVNVAYMLKILDLEKIKLYQGVAPGVGILLSGEQFIGQDYYDLKEEKALKTLDYGINFMLNSKIRILENVFLSVEYRYGLGIRQIEANPSATSQISRNRFHAALFGLAFAF
jgi:hypothetical protein